MVNTATFIRRTEEIIKANPQILEDEYRQRFGILPKEVQADKIYLGKDNRKYIQENHMDCFNHPLGRPPKEENDVRGHLWNLEKSISGKQYQGQT